MILMIDNYDSFTYNIVQYAKELGANLKVIRNDDMSIKEIEKLNPEKIIISPGPATPNEAGISLEVIDYFKGIKPILGICLGHQAIAQSFGGKVIRAKNMMHGKTSMIVQRENLPDIIEITSHSKDDNEIMSLQIKGYDIYGVQFHPESILSEYGHEILDNFLKL